VAKTGPYLDTFLIINNASILNVFGRKSCRGLRYKAILMPRSAPLQFAAGHLDD
jgi:hypothetical protein